VSEEYAAPAEVRFPYPGQNLGGEEVEGAFEPAAGLT
jgi:hypothetical protein